MKPRKIFVYVESQTPLRYANSPLRHIGGGSISRDKIREVFPAKQRYLRWVHEMTPGLRPGLTLDRGSKVRGKGVLAVISGSEFSLSAVVESGLAERKKSGASAGSGWDARSYALLSVAAAAVTISLKFGAYLLTGSIGLFSDAAESVVNLFAAGAAFWALSVAARPADEEHAYGHGKVEYFASGLESALIIVAAAWISFTAFGRLLDPEPLEQIPLGLSLTLIAAAINGGVALVILRAGKRLRSITLEADAKHLLTDVWTSFGVIIGVGAAQITGWLVLDPLVALLVAANIVWTGIRLLRDTAGGLLDEALPDEDQKTISKVLAKYENGGRVHFHALRTRQSGQRRFVSMHVLVPGEWSVKRGHDLSEEIDKDLRASLPGSTIFIHIEPTEDPASFEDVGLDRKFSDGG
jgi:cation diffusion facilitator family transporter